MRIFFLILASTFCLNSVFGQSDIHYQKAEMVSEVGENVRKLIPEKHIYLVVDLISPKLEIAVGGPAAPNADVIDANGFDSTELQYLQETWKTQIEHGSIVILPLNYDDPLQYQRLIDSIKRRNATKEGLNFVYLEICRPIDGWNKLQFYRQDKTFGNGDIVLMRYLSSDIYIPAHFYYSNAKNVVISDLIFAFKLSFANGKFQSKLTNRIKL